LTFIYAPTQSLVGSAQIVARALEVAMHKVHELKFPLDRVVEAWRRHRCRRRIPISSPPWPATNDAIIYGGQVHLIVTGAVGDARALAEKMPSQASRDHGRPFAEIFKAAKGDFYAIDPMLFSPAEVIVTALETGESFHHGRIHLELSRCIFWLKSLR